MQQPEVRLCLQPLQVGSASRKRADSPEREASRNEGSERQDKHQRTIANLRGELQNMRAKASGAAPRGSGSKGAGRGKGRGKPAKGGTEGGPSSRMPRELIGMASTTEEHDTICYDYNLGGCAKARPGESCAKGKHVCCRHGCFKPHSQRKHG